MWGEGRGGGAELLLLLPEAASRVCATLPKTKEARVGSLRRDTCRRGWARSCCCGVRVVVAVALAAAAAAAVSSARDTSTFRAVWLLCALLRPSKDRREEALRGWSTGGV